MSPAGDSDWDSDDDEMFYAKDGAPTPFWASDSDEEAEEEEDGEEDEEDEDEDEEGRATARAPSPGHGGIFVAVYFIQRRGGRQLAYLQTTPGLWFAFSYRSEGGV